MNKELLLLEIEGHLDEIKRLEFESRMSIRETHRKISHYTRKLDVTKDIEQENILDIIEKSKFYMEHDKKQVNREIKRIQIKIEESEKLLSEL